MVILGLFYCYTRMVEKKMETTFYVPLLPLPPKLPLLRCEIEIWFGSSFLRKADVMHHDCIDRHGGVKQGPGLQREVLVKGKISHLILCLKLSSEQNVLHPWQTYPPLRVRFKFLAPNNHVCWILFICMEEHATTASTQLQEASRACRRPPFLRGPYQGRVLIAYLQ